MVDYMDGINAAVCGILWFAVVICKLGLTHSLTTTHYWKVLDSHTTFALMSREKERDEI